ncbi:TPA: glycosyltransferase family 2 protein [Enterobacter hormaechei subsp. steigerwaltii]|uniref:glycosyltransferase family 2 protein n=1 Tax=Enterobacter hormaechei TaxID=158836 RepID=UPI00265B7CC0|nr:glycosyltransferase family 2 protein [Enterobacter hormaechei]MDO0899672.1 glycosyltransferase family 2 protein [Enterobacter hormaechei]HCM9098761.1 glycosyltransferase family 2 protein [Enterobacter hormaechei subsp. steigerwaltii]
MQYQKDAKSLVVLLNWNGAGLTIDCCNSLLDLDTKTQDILVVDNFSKPEDFSLLKTFLEDACTALKNINEDIPKKLSSAYAIESIIRYDFSNGTSIYLARSLINHGFSRGCNFGALVAEALRYPELIFLNNDTVVESDFLDVLHDKFEGYDIVIPQIRYFEPKNVIWNCGGDINRFGKRIYFFANEDITTLGKLEEAISISFATGCCMLMRTDFYIQTGMFTEDFFFGEEDIDFALRLKKLNAKIACIPKSIIYHKVGASLAGDLTKLRRKAFIHYLNRTINMKKHLGLIWYIWMLPAIAKMIINLIKIYKMNISDSISFALKLCKESFRKNKVEKDYFEDIMTNGY